MYKESNFPEFCYGILNTTDQVVVIKRGETGYYQYYNGDLKGKAHADKLNAALGITKNQAEAMLVGSMFGWEVPGADPNIYDENGKPYTSTNPRPRNARQGKKRGY